MCPCPVTASRGVDIFAFGSRKRGHDEDTAMECCDPFAVLYNFAYSRPMAEHPIASNPTDSGRQAQSLGAFVAHRSGQRRISPACALRRWHVFVLLLGTPEA